MDVMLTYDRENMDALGSADIMKLIAKHQQKVVPNLQHNMDYYMGKQEILEKEREEEDAPNVTPVCNHAKDIADTASGYFLGNPLTYALDGDKQDERAKRAFEAFRDELDRATTDDDDQENALMLSICGKAYEYIYAAEYEPHLQEKPIDPQNAFIVYDDSIEHKELFGVYYYTKTDSLDSGKEQMFYYILVMTETELKYYKIQKGAEIDVLPYRVEQHRLGYVPLVEYKNNRFAIGDFEQQVGLIDAYNILMADRVIDKEQFVDAIMVVYGAILGDTDDEVDKKQADIRKRKLLEMPEDARAEYLVRQLDESGMETLRKAFKEDIYGFSHVPNLTDENFAGNSSGVAMEYKLLGLEMLTKTKERWYRRGLRKRINIFLHYLGLKGETLEEKDISVTFTRSLPKNLVEIAQVVSYLGEMVSNKTLLGQIPFVEDPDAEMEALEQQKQEAAQALADQFGMMPQGTENTPPEVEDNEE